MRNRLQLGDIDGVPVLLYDQNPYVGNTKIDYPADNIMGVKEMLFRNSETILPWSSLTNKITNEPDNRNIGYQYQPGIYTKI